MYQFNKVGWIEKCSLLILTEIICETNEDTYSNNPRGLKCQYIVTSSTVFISTYFKVIYIYALPWQHIVDISLLSLRLSVSIIIIAFYLICYSVL